MNREMNVSAFKVQLGKTYYNHGFFNVPILPSNFLGEHGEPIKLSFEGSAPDILAVINRTANLNGSVRVLRAHSNLRNWFQRHFHQGDNVYIKIKSNHHLFLAMQFPS